MDNDNILDQIFNGHDDLLEDVLSGDYEIRTGRKPVEEMEVKQGYFLTQDDTLPSMARLNGRWVKIKDSVLSSLRSIASSYYGDEASRILSGFKFKMHESAPPGFEGTVKAMKDEPGIDNPYALAWHMKNKGYKSHKNPDGSDKTESVDVAEQLIDMLETTGLVVINESDDSFSVGNFLADPGNFTGKNKKSKKPSEPPAELTPEMAKQGYRLHPVTDRPYLPKKPGGGINPFKEGIDEGNNNSLPDGMHHDTNTHPSPNAGLRLQSLYHSIGTILPELHALVTSCIGEERAALTMLFNEVMTAHSEIGNYLSCTNQAPDPQIESLLSHYSTVHSQIMDALNPYSTHNLAVATGPYQLKGTHLNDSEGEQSLPFARARR